MASSLASGSPRPSKGELRIAELQGYTLAKIAKGYQLVKSITDNENGSSKSAFDKIEHIKITTIEDRLRVLNIVLPNAPTPVGNYKPYKISGK